MVICGNTFRILCRHHCHCCKIKNPPVVKTFVLTTGGFFDTLCLPHKGRFWCIFFASSRSQILQIGCRQIIFHIVPRQIVVDHRICMRNRSLPVPDLHFRSGSPGDDRICPLFPVLCLSLKLRHRRRLIPGSGMGAVRSFHSLLCHLVPSLSSSTDRHWTDCR